LENDDSLGESKSSRSASIRFSDAELDSSTQHRDFGG
jgi:hypothetical protein